MIDLEFQSHATPPERFQAVPIALLAIASFIGSEMTSLDDPIPEMSLPSEMRPDRDQPKGIGGKHGITSHEQTSSHQYKRSFSIALASSKWSRRDRQCLRRIWVSSGWSVTTTMLTEPLSLGAIDLVDGDSAARELVYRRRNSRSWLVAVQHSKIVTGSAEARIDDDRLPS